jgi:hypothetical protein
MSEQQFSLFVSDPRIQPVDPHVEPADKPRLTRQCYSVLERLRRGPVSNVQLLLIAIRYSARIHDLRSAGYKIETEKRGDGGIVFYSLISEPEAQ